MKILIYCPSYKANSGGLENMTLQLANYFRREGNVVNIISFQTPLRVENTDWIHYKPSVVKQILLFMNSDVFYMPNISLKGMWLFTFNPLKNWVVSHNGWYGDYQANGSKRILEYFKIKLSTIAKNIAVSHTVSEYLGIKCEIIPNCYDCGVFYYRPHIVREHTVVFVGRLVSDKGIDILIKACENLWSSGIQAQLHVIGDGPEINWIRSYMSNTSNADKIVLHGYLSGKDLAEQLNRHKVLVVPSKCPEGFGLVVLEGLSSGCKVIVSDMGALSEVLGEFGEVFSLDNIEKLSQLIKDALTETELNIDLRSLKLRKYLDLHSIENIGKAYLNVFARKKK